MLGRLAQAAVASKGAARAAADAARHRAAAREREAAAEQLQHVLAQMEVRQMEVSLCDHGRLMRGMSL